MQTQLACHGAKGDLLESLQGSLIVEECRGRTGPLDLLDPKTSWGTSSLGVEAAQQQPNEGLGLRLRLVVAFSLEADTPIALQRSPVASKQLSLLLQQRYLRTSRGNLGLVLGVGQDNTARQTSVLGLFQHDDRFDTIVAITLDPEKGVDAQCHVMCLNALTREYLNT